MFFDLGGTLVEERNLPAWIDLGRRLGLDLNEDHLAHAYLEATREADVPEPPAVEALWRRILERACGHDVPEGVADEFVRLSRRLPRSLPLYSDTKRCLVQLSEEGRSLGVISNASSVEAVGEILGHAGIAPFFPLVVAGGTEGLAKPNPEIFRTAVRRAGVSPGDAFYVGDLPYRDAKAAAAAGLGSVWLNREGWGFGDDPPEITSLTELPFHVRQVEAERAVPSSARRRSR